MPNIPTVGVFIPNGYLNAGSSVSPSGQGDAYGNIYPSGLCPGKVIQVSASEASGLAVPGTSLYDGAYQYVLLDSGATASLATQGLAAFIRLDSGANQGAFPETDWENGTVTTADQVNALGGAAVFGGIFINPATINGVANGPTPGQYCFLFVGAGRAKVTYNGSATAGNNVLPVAPASAQTGQFAPGAAAASIYPNGIALQTTSGAGSTGVAAWQELFYRIANQGV
jgi:hypothetical protein